jgi:hypothetical protein
MLGWGDDEGVGGCSVLGGEFEVGAYRISRRRESHRPSKMREARRRRRSTRRAR